MAEQSYTANRSLVVAGQPVADGDTFTAEPEALRVPLAKDWVTEKSKSKPQSKRKTT